MKVLWVVNATVSRQSHSPVIGARITTLAELQLRRNHLAYECIEQSDRFELVAFFAHERGHDVELQVDAILEILYA